MQRLWVLLVALGLAACSGLPWNVITPKVGVAEVEIKRLGLLEQRFDVGLRISNPNDFDLTIEALEFELEVNGRPFANGLSRTSTRVPASSSAMLRVDAFMQSENLVQQFKTLTPDSLKDGVPYRIKGRFKMDKSSSWLPFDHSGVYGGDKKKLNGKAS
jgi:LEA14-like dessication related protein